jgi:hypothetical protein
MALAVVIGWAAGIGVVVFYRLIDLSYFVFITWFGARLNVGLHASYRPVLTARDCGRHGPLRGTPLWRTDRWYR